MGLRPAKFHEKPSGHAERQIRPCGAGLQPAADWQSARIEGARRCVLPHKTGPRYNKSAVKLEIELNIAADAAVMAGLQEHLRKEAILALFAGRKIPAGKAAQELGLTRIAFMDLLRQRGIPYADYTAEDWESDARAIVEFERRPKIA